MNVLALASVLALSGSVLATITAYLPLHPFACYFILYALLTLYIMENLTLYNDLTRAQQAHTPAQSNAEAESKRSKFLLSTIKTLVQENKEMREVSSFIARVASAPQQGRAPRHTSSTRSL